MKCIKTVEAAVLRRAFLINKTNFELFFENQNNWKSVYNEPTEFK